MILLCEVFVHIQYIQKYKNTKNQALSIYIKQHLPLLTCTFLISYPNDVAISVGNRQNGPKNP